MPTPNPQVQELLDQAKAQLAAIRAEKLRLFPPNTDPLGSPDRYPGSYTKEQIEHRNQLNAQIEMLEQRIDDLQTRLYSK
jgi:hypothetical protein